MKAEDMSTELDGTGEEPGEAGVGEVGTVEPAVVSGGGARWFWGPVKWAVGALLMLTPAGALVVAGWLQRFLQRAIYRGWWRRCRGRLGRFREFAAEEPLLAEFRHAPNWVVSSNFRQRWRAGVGAGRFRGRCAALAGSLVGNVGLGVRVLLNVGVLTVPWGVLWAVGWWGGWQNSFHKGYEHFHVGPLLSWLGILGFIGVMFYVPMATARQAATGEWRAFWQGRTVWILVKESWMPSAWVAVLYAAANGVVMALKSWPQFIPQILTSLREEGVLEPSEVVGLGIGVGDGASITDAQALGILNRHYLVSAFVVFALLVGLKRVSAWLYSGAVLRALRRGRLAEEALSGVERRLLGVLGALEVEEPVHRSWVFRLLAWGATRVGRAVCATAVFLAWFGFVGAIYVSEFVAYHPVVGWLNQPLVQMPVFRYIPAALEDPLPGWLAAAVVVMGAGLVAAWRSRRAERAGRVRRPVVEAGGLRGGDEAGVEVAGHVEEGAGRRG
jgi:hypothetical protein